MKGLFEAGWKILSIEMTFEGFTFAVWHPLAFGFLIWILFHLLLFKSNKEG